MLALLISGAATVLAIFPWVSDATRQGLRQRWSRKLLKALAVELDADIAQISPGTMVVANHISWLDIFAINAAIPAAFVSKADVRGWPLIGWLAEANDTVFLKRGSRGHARLINEEIGQLLGQGKAVAVFPEGTTTDGTHILHFHGALLQPALAAGKAVVPLALSYWETSGERSLAPAYIGDMSLGRCIQNILARPKLVAKLRASAPLGEEGAERRQVAIAARLAISTGAGLPPPNN